KRGDDRDTWRGVMGGGGIRRGGRYVEDAAKGYGEEYDGVLGAARSGNFGTVPQPLVDIRKDGASWYAGHAENAASALEYMLAKHPDITKSARGHARMLGQIAFARSSLGERGPALRYAVKALARWPWSPYPYIALLHTVIGVHPRHVLRAARLFRRGMA